MYLNSRSAKSLHFLANACTELSLSELAQRKLRQKVKSLNADIVVRRVYATVHILACCYHWCL